MEKYPANLNLAHVFDLIQGERSAMTGVDGLDVEALQFFEEILTLLCRIFNQFFFYIMW